VGSAQRDPIIHDTVIVPIPDAKLKVVSREALKESRTIVIPTVLEYLSIDGTMRSTSAAVRGNAQVTFEYTVVGLTDSFVEEMAQVAQWDLIARLRRQGLTVLDYLDIETNPLVARMGRQKVDTTYGSAIVRDDASRTTYAVVAPSSAQRFAIDPRQPAIGFQALAKELNAIVIVPELWIRAPRLDRQRMQIPGVLAAKLNADPGLDLQKASFSFVTPSGVMGSISLTEALETLSQDVGAIVHAGADSLATGVAVGGGGLVLEAGMIGLSRSRSAARNKSRNDQLDFVISPSPYSLAVLVGAASFFHAAAAAIAK
jgi:hypothetical protein